MFVEEKEQRIDNRTIKVINHKNYCILYYGQPIKIRTGLHSSNIRHRKFFCKNAKCKGLYSRREYREIFERKAKRVKGCYEQEAK